ncbi:hypothetical protein [Mycoplasma sp. 4404]|uniref:hypothetical protein n=1 Tax=Mycoplasma sp. 4404 TaxID=3108530 RepID=UPI002B1CE91C|nr:hypothetical protein [Mycoplasma sp. 4404]MEA4162627.1 hypothetical protein [Mycoplasma sp. 4404]
MKKINKFIKSISLGAIAVLPFFTVSCLDKIIKGVIPQPYKGGGGNYFDNYKSRPKTDVEKAILASAYGNYDLRYSINNSDAPQIEPTKFEDIGKFTDYHFRLPELMYEFTKVNGILDYQTFIRDEITNRLYEDVSAATSTSNAFFYEGSYKSIWETKPAKLAEFEDLIKNHILKDQSVEQRNDNYKYHLSYDIYFANQERQFMKSDEIFMNEDLNNLAETGKIDDDENDGVQHFAVNFYASILGDWYRELLFRDYIKALDNYAQLRTWLYKNLILKLNDETKSAEEQLKEVFLDKENTKEDMKWYLNKAISATLEFLHPAYYPDLNFGDPEFLKLIGFTDYFEETRVKSWDDETYNLKYRNKRVLVPFWTNEKYTNLDAAKLWDEAYKFLNILFAFYVLVNDNNEKIQQQFEAIFKKADGKVSDSSGKRFDKKSFDCFGDKTFANNDGTVLYQNWNNLLSFFNRKENYYAIEVYETSSSDKVNWTMTKEEAIDVINSYFNQNISNSNLKDILGLKYSSFDTKPLDTLTDESEEQE